MHTGGSCQLGDALDGAFHIVLGHHHKVGHLVDHHEDVRIGGHLALGAGGRMYLAGAHGLVEVLDVAESEEFEVGVACIHLFDHPFEGLCGFLRIGDDRGQQVRDACVGGQFHALGIHHDQTHLFGRGTHDDRSEHRVDKTRLTGTGGTGHQQVRHLGQVGGHEVPSTSLPMPESIGFGSPTALSERSTSPKCTISRSSFGISMPMADLPGIGERIRTSELATA